MNFLLFAGSLRTESLNKKLLQAAHHLITQDENTQSEMVDIRSLEIPLYDGDHEEANGIPQGVKKLGEMIQKAHALIIAGPEYNHTISGVLKNIIDWVSRLKPVPFEKKPVLLLGASPGIFGSIRGLEFTRVPLEALNAYVYPQPFALPKAGNAFSSGKLVDTAMEKNLLNLLESYKEFVKKFQVYTDRK